MAIKSDGSLWAWGNNEFGQLGDGTAETRPSPVKIMDDVAYVSAGPAHSAAITADGTLWTWGRNEYWELGHDTSEDEENQLVPVAVMEGVASVAAGTFHTVAIGLDDYLWAWGLRGFGIGEGRTIEESRLPIRVLDLIVESDGTEDGSVVGEEDVAESGESEEESAEELESSWNTILLIILASVLALFALATIATIVTMIVLRGKKERQL